MLVQAMVDQVVNNLSNRSYTVAGMTTQSLLGAGQPGVILYGPRSPLRVAAVVRRTPRPEAVSRPPDLLSRFFARPAPPVRLHAPYPGA
jgi:hypothetical protein